MYKIQMNFKKFEIFKSNAFLLYLIVFIYNVWL